MVRKEPQCSSHRQPGNHHRLPYRARGKLRTDAETGPQADALVDVPNLPFASSTRESFPGRYFQRVSLVANQKLGSTWMWTLLLFAIFLVGVTGLEPAASWSQTRRDTNFATPRQYFLRVPTNAERSPAICGRARVFGIEGHASLGRSQSNLFARAQSEGRNDPWCGRRDSNPRPFGPKPNALIH